MNPDLAYLNQLQQAGMIQPNDYINQLGTMYAHDPTSFSEEEVDLIEKQFKAFDIPFSRDMEHSEQSLSSISNQFISGFAEGFTTLGWAEEPDTAAERIAANMGHLAGFAPDIIAAFFTMGASTSWTAAKLASKQAMKSAKKHSVDTVEKILGGKIPVSKMGQAMGGTTTATKVLTGTAVITGKIGKGLSKGAKAIQDTLAEVAKKSEKLGPFHLRKKIMNENGRPYYMLRSLPMRSADFILDSAKTFSKKSGIEGKAVFDSWLIRKTLGADAAKNMAEEGLRLGLALGASSWKEGPEGMGRAAFHGAIAGAFFGGVGEYVKIGRYFTKARELSKEGLADAATKLIKQGRKKVKNRARKINKQQESRKVNQVKKELNDIHESTIGLDRETAIDMWAKGITGASFTGVQATMNDLPLPDQLYEYALGFFFGASGRSHKDKQYYKYLFDEKTSIRPSNSLEYDLYQRIKSPDFQKLDPDVQNRITRHFKTLREEQINRTEIIAGNVSFTVREMLKEDPALAEKVIAEIEFKQSEKSQEVLDFEKKVKKEGKDVIEEAKKVIGNFNTKDIRGTIEEQARRIIAEKDIRKQTEVKKDIKKEIDRELEPSDEKFKHRQPGVGKKSATIKTLTNKARKDARSKKNNYKNVLKTHGKTAAQIYTKERKRVEQVLKKQVQEIEVAKEYEKDIEQQKADLQAKIELMNSEGEKITLGFNDMKALEQSLKDLDNPDTYADMAINKLANQIYDQIDLTLTEKDGTKVIAIVPKELKEMLKGFVMETEFQFDAFIERVKSEFGDIKINTEMQNSIKEFIKVTEHYQKKVFPIIQAHNKKKGARDGNIDENSEYVPEGVEEIGGQDQAVYVPANKINQIHAIPGEPQVREQILQVIMRTGTGDEQKTHLLEPLGIHIGEAFKKGEGDIFIATPEVLMKEVGGKLPEGWYLFGGSKDTGTLIIQRLPFQTKDKNSKDYISEKDLTELNTVLDKEVPVGKEYKQQRTANVIWELVENGLIKGPLTKENIMKAFEVYKKNVEKTGYKNVIKFNKYQTLAHGNEIPLNPRVFEKILGKETKAEGDPINIWSTVKNNFENLSNLAPRQFEFDGKTYESVEHAYQTLKSGKFDREIYNSPEWKEGWKKKIGLPADKAKNRELMKNIVRESIVQNENVSSLLQSTKRAPLEHNNPSGKKDFWTKEFPGILQEVRTELFPELVSSEHLRAIAVKDLPSSIIDKGDVIKSNNSGTDGVIYVRNDVFDTIANDFGIDIANGFFKPVGFVKARDGKGNIRMKAGGFRAGEKLDKWMKDNDIHYVVYDSAIKVGLNRKALDYEKNEFGYNEKTGEWFSKDLTPGDIIRMRPEEMHINMGVKEEASKVKNINIIKGMLDKNNMTQFSPEHRAALDILREKSLRGDPATNKKFLKQYRVPEGGKENFDYSWLEVDKLDMDVILEVMADRGNSPAAQEIVRRILEADKDPLMKIAEKWEIKLEDEAKNQQLSDVLPSIKYLPMGYLWKTHQSFVQKALRNYQISRATKMVQEHGFYQKLGAYDAEIRALNNGKGIEDGTFMLSSGHRGDIIDVNGNKETLDAAYQEYKRLEKGIKTRKDKKVQTAKDLQSIKRMKKKLDMYEEALTYALTRAPVSGNGGVRILRFNGFLKRKGYSVHTNELDDYYLGGADKDADAVHAIQRFGSTKDVLNDGVRVRSVDKIIKDSFKKVQNELELDPNKPGEVTDIKEPGTLEALGGATEADLGFESIFDPIQRLKVAQAAYLGKKNMGMVVNSYTRMQWLWDVISSEAGKDGLYLAGTWDATNKVKSKKSWKKPSGPKVKGLETHTDFYIKIKDGVTFEDMIKDGYNLINLAADSADYSTMYHASKSLSNAFNKYFEVYGKNKDGKIERIHQKGEKGKAPGIETEFSEHQVFNPKHGMKNIGVVKNFHDSLWGWNSNNFTPELARRAASDYLEHHTNIDHFYTALADKFADIPIDVDPFNYYKRENVLMLANALSKEISSNPIYKDLGIFYPHDTILNPKELQRLLYGKGKQNQDMLWDTVTDMIGMSYAISKSHAMIEHMMSLGYTYGLAQKIVGQAMKETFMIKQDSWGRNEKIKREGLSISQQKTSNTKVNEKKAAEEILNPGRDNASIQNYIEASKTKWISTFVEHMGWKLGSKEIELAEGVYDAWLMANPIVDKQFREDIKGVKSQENLMKEFDVLNKVINEAIGKYGDGYEGKVKGLNKYRELDYERYGKTVSSPDLTLDTLYSMRGKVLNKIRPRVDHLLKSSTINNKNRLEYFQFMQNVFDRANAMELTPKNYPEYKKVAKSLMRIKAIEEIIKEDSKPVKEQKKPSQEKEAVEVEEEFLEKIRVKKDKKDIKEEKKPLREEIEEVVKEEIEKPAKKKGVKEFPKFTESRIQDLIERFHLRPVTEKGEVELTKLMRFLRANPDLVAVVEAEYSTAMERFKGYRESFGRMTTNDLELFNQYLELRYHDRGNMVRKFEKVMKMLSKEDARITFGGKKEGFDRTDMKRVKEGTKTTTIRTEDWMKKHWFEEGSSDMVVKIGGEYYTVKDRGLKDFNPNDKEGLIKSEGVKTDKDGNPLNLRKHEADFFEGKRKMHVLEIKKTAPKQGNWSNLSLFKRVAEDLVPFEKRLNFIPETKIIGEDGRLKPYALEVPTSTLEMVRGTADAFHRLNSAWANYVEKRVGGLFSMLETDDKQIRADFEIVFDAITWERAYKIKMQGRNRKKQNSKRSYLQKIMAKKSKEYVEEQYNKSQKLLKKLEDRSYHIATEGKQMKFKQFKNLVDKSMTSFLSEINQNLVQSKMTPGKQGNKFTKMLKEMGFKPEYKNTDIDLESNKKPDDAWILNMNEWFLDKTGFINEAKIDKIYKGIEFLEYTTQESISRLPSINDVLFFNYHMEMKDIAQRVLGDKATKIETENFIKKYIKENPMNVHKVGQFIDKKGESSLYFPQLGHFETRGKRKKLDVWMKEIIDIAGQITAKELPANLRDQYYKNEITLAEAKKDYQMQVKGELELRKGASIYHEGLENYRTVSDMLSTRPRSWAGNYKAGNLKSRSEAFLPYWRTDLKAMQDYGSAISKNFFDINAGIRMHTHIKHFEKARPFGDFTDNWSAYMKDAASNMLGYASLRNIDLHGIKKGEVALLKKFIDAGAPGLGERGKKMGLLQGYEKRFLQDVADHIEPDRVEKYILRQTHGNKKAVIDKELSKLRLQNAKKLADPKNIDKIGKFKLSYSLVSDEAWTNMAMRFEDMTGVKPWFAKDIPTDNPRVRRLLLAKKLQAFSAWEAKFELISLLSHPKTTITNFLGGTQNLFADVGAMNIYRATKFGGEDYLLNEIGLRGKKFTAIDARGNKVEKKIESYEDILQWIESTGALEGMFVTEIGLDNTLRKGKATRFTQELARRILLDAKLHPEILTDKKVWEERKDLTILEMRKEHGFGDKAFKLGASFMSWSEYQLRTRSFLAHYLNARELYKTGTDNQPLDFMKWNDPELIQKSIKGVEASQFMYHAAYRSNYSQTSMGRVLTRFHPYAWNSIRRRFGPQEGVYKVAAKAGWDKNLYATKRAQRQFTMDLMAMSLSYIFMSSIFEYALSPPMSWMQDTAQWAFGDEKERERAFFSQWPHPALAPLAIATPPIARTVLAPTNAFLSGDWDKFAQFYGWTYLPFGRMIRDIKRTYDSPAMAVDFMTGVPLHRIHQLRRDQIEEREEEGTATLEDAEEMIEKRR